MSIVFWIMHKLINFAKEGEHYIVGATNHNSMCSMHLTAIVPFSLYRMSDRKRAFSPSVVNASRAS